MSDQPTYPDIHVQLTEADRDAWDIIAAVAKALRSGAGDDAAAEFRRAALACGSYDEALQLAMTAVDVS